MAQQPQLTSVRLCIVSNSFPNLRFGLLIQKKLTWSFFPSVFIFRYKPTANLEARLEVHRVCPILRHFSISTAQAQRLENFEELKSGINTGLIRSRSGRQPFLANETFVS